MADIKDTRRIIDVNELRVTDVPIVGGKGANLGELTSSGFPVPNAFVLTTVSYDYFIATSGIMEKILALPYPTDGIVVKLADAAFRVSLGATAHHPRGEMAFKFTNRSKQTVLTGVEWSFGKSSLTPVALLEPVEIGGTTIKRASLCNVQNILDLGLGIGDIVTVEYGTMADGKFGVRIVDDEGRVHVTMLMDKRRD